MCNFSIKKTIALGLFFIIFCFSILVGQLNAKEMIGNLPVRGLSIASPKPEQLDSFIQFIDHELAATTVNTLFVKINYGFKFKQYPKLAEPNSLSESDIKRIVKVARNHQIKLIPIINLLGHQSWKQENIKSLLRAYPELEEPPGVKLNDPDFYTRAYCPNHPDVHQYVFSMLDELIDAFETDSVHVGMDEVFILGEDGCSRCKGKNKAELFAQEVNLLHDYLAAKGINMFIWGDRLLDGTTSGIGKWAAAENGTHPAIDLINKNITICDWQYRTAPPTTGYFALKGFNVISATFQMPNVADQQVSSILSLRAHNNDVIKHRLQGIISTYWGSFNSFNQCYLHGDCANEKSQGAVNTFKRLFPKTPVKS